MKVEPEIEMPEREPMRPRTFTLNADLRRRAKRERSRRRKFIERARNASCEDYEIAPK